MGFYKIIIDQGNLAIGFYQVKKGISPEEMGFPEFAQGRRVGLF